MPVTPVEAAIAFTVVTAGAIVQGSVGFGAALVAAPVLVLLDRTFVPVPMLISGMTLAVLMSIRERRSVDTSVSWALAGRALGIAPAVLLVGTLSDFVFSMLFATLVLLAVVLSLTGWHVPITRRNLFFTGAVSGFSGTLASIGGPPMGLLYQHEEARRLRGTIAFYFVFGGVMSLVALWWAGHFGTRELALAGVLMPGIVTGFLLSRFTAASLPAQHTRPAVLIVSAATAMVVLCRAMW